LLLSLHLFWLYFGCKPLPVRPFDVLFPFFHGLHVSLLKAPEHVEIIAIWRYVVATLVIALTQQHNLAQVSTKFTVFS